MNKRTILFISSWVLVALFCIIGFVAENVVLFLMGIISFCITTWVAERKYSQPKSSKQRSKKRSTFFTPGMPEPPQRSRVIHSFGRHAPGILYEEVTLNWKHGAYYYVTLSVEDRFHAGGDEGKVPQECLTDTSVDEEALLRYIAQKHRYMGSLGAFYTQNISESQNDFNEETPPTKEEETACKTVEEDILEQNIQMSEKEYFRPYYLPEYISERFIYDHQKYLNLNHLTDDFWAADFSKSVITSLFGFDESILEKCLLLFSASHTIVDNGFPHLWCAVFDIRDKNNLVDGEKELYESIFNYQTGKLLIKAAKELVALKTISGNTAEIQFKSCMDTSGFANFKGFVNFDFITALSLLLIKKEHPNLEKVTGNIYFSDGIYIAKRFPFKVESNLDQRYIYGLINSR